MEETYLKVYTLDLTNLELNDTILGLLSEERRERIRHAVTPYDAKQIAYSKLLLRYMVTQTGLGIGSPRDVTKTRSGKPIANTPGLYFNTAHEGHYVVGAISNAGDVGIDIREEDPFLFEKRLTEQWTKNEAFDKCIGVGKKGPKTMTIDRDTVFYHGELYFLSFYEEPKGYMTCACVRGADPEAERINVSSTDMESFLYSLSSERWEKKSARLQERKNLTRGIYFCYN